MSAKENMPGLEIVLAEIRILSYDHPLVHGTPSSAAAVVLDSIRVAS